MNVSVRDSWTLHFPWRGEHDQVNSYQQKVMDVVDDRVPDLSIAKNSRVGPRQCMEALTQPDLERDVEEVGVEDRHPAMIVDFCRKVMEIYDFQLTAEQLEELGCTPDEIQFLLRYLWKKRKSDTMYSNTLGGVFWVHSTF
jgi:hypothetical protein